MALDKDDIKQLIAILQKGLIDEEEDTVHSPKKQKTTKSKNIKKKSTNNLFENMSEFRMHKDDVQIDKKLRTQNPTQRTRQYKPITVKCRICGKQEEVSPSVVDSIERYKCNKCCSSAG